MNVIVKSIPNTITCLNLVSGFLAIVLSFSPDTCIACDLFGWQWAAIMIFAACFFDFCDGLAARTLHAYSEIGKELDSLCDLVSFGVAPALMLYNMLEHLHGPSLWHLLVVVIPVLGALRLARFNVRDADGDNSVFHGLPIPANAIFWVGYVSWLWEYRIPDHYVIYIVVVLVSLTMVSNITLVSLKFRNFSLRDNYRRYIVLLATVVLVALLGFSGFTWAILLYLLMSVFTRR